MASSTGSPRRDLVKWERCLIKPRTKGWPSKRGSAPGNAHALWAGRSNGATKLQEWFGSFLKG